MDDVPQKISNKRKLFTLYQVLIHKIIQTSFTTTALIHKSTHVLRYTLTSFSDFCCYKTDKKKRGATSIMLTVRSLG